MFFYSKSRNVNNICISFNKTTYEEKKKINDAIKKLF